MAIMETALTSPGQLGDFAHCVQNGRVVAIEHAADLRQRQGATSTKHA
jgi:hypothetical protein